MHTDLPSFCHHRMGLRYALAHAMVAKARSAPEEKMTVKESATRVNTKSSSNVNALVIKGSDLNALADNPEDLQSDLQALAGPGGGSIFVDGFSGGQLPSKESIREIRINQNPFSAEYDRLGLGRIEILTKPGTDKFRSSGYYNFAHDFWNSRNPYAQQKAPFLLKEYGGSLSDPVNKRSSFFLDIRRDSVDNSSRRTLLLQRRGFSPVSIRALGGGATQFSINAGDPVLSASQTDVGAFVSDDWRVRPNLTLSLGLRYETQTNIHDWRDFGPRLGIAWAPGGRSKGGRPKTVLRAGSGFFYDRFGLSNTLTALPYNGIVQQQYVIANPDFFPTIPLAASLAGFQTTQAIRAVSSTLLSPYIVQSAVSVERELPFNTTVAVTYANSHGLHMLRSRNTNAPLPGTYDPGVPPGPCVPWPRKK